tara:strand:- start:255 stop:779 length:525 start_codon:yes stop_codon:yes gene_type:complete
VGLLKKLSRFVALSVSLIAGFAIGTVVIVDYEKSTFKPWGWAKGDDPIILNCYGGDFNELYLNDPVQFWAEKDYNIAFIQQDPPPELCKKDFVDGFILLKKRSYNDGSTIAVTERRVVLGRIRAATIYFNPGSYRLDHVIEHELGHAFGFTHMPEEGHIMHPNYDKMGPGFWVP